MTSKINGKEKRFRCVSLEHLRITSKDYPIWVSLQKRKKKALGMGLSQKEAKKVVEGALAEAEKNISIPEDSLINDKYNEG